MMEEAELETKRNENNIIYFIELYVVLFLPRESILMLGLDLRFLFNFETPRI